MINLICGLLAMVIITLFLGGLGHSIWDNTGSIAFPIIVILVLIMAYKGFIEELKSADHT
ncbi:MAG: hypothetical protein HKM94_10015 [Halobacteria archaeon]|jgi:hypothetical protein|nr:hypothetical protein [Halobacteria archaeon]